MYQYEHTQPGTWVRLVLSIILLFSAGAWVLVQAVEGGGAATVALLFALLVLVAMLAIFHSLTVRVSEQEVELSFGVGLFRRRFRLQDIRSASVAQSQWFGGVGINKIRSGWLFSVGGLSAVQIKMKNGRRYKIGTDEPRELHRAIGAAMRTLR